MTIQVGDPLLLKLPKNLQDCTAEEHEACIAHLAEKPLGKLRQMQSITRQQIQWAHRQGKTDALESLQVQADHLTQAVDRREFPDD